MSEFRELEDLGLKLIQRIRKEPTDKVTQSTKIIVGDDVYRVELKVSLIKTKRKGEKE